MNFGFVIDNRACIGCHACSTACKSENDVPLGVYRTWVKYVETGLGADARRHFQVTRCNHCANPPCVRICPVTAMYQRQDGIVEFDGRICIGCKACLQACPYDAIYIDPDSGTAAKCHYCSHRTDLGLEPACVVVCPTHAILSGDLDDPQSEIARVLARERATVRRPEQGTAPKLFYIEATHATLHPTASDRLPASFVFADVVARSVERVEQSVPLRPARPATAASGARLRAVQPQGLPAGGALGLAGRMANQMIQVSYNAQHEAPWHWPVAAYLVTKALSSGLFGMLALGLLLGLVPEHGPSLVAAGLASLLLLALTTALLIYDLERPERFLRVLLRPQWRSWLARGAFLLVGFGAVCGLWWAMELSALGSWLEPAWLDSLRPALLVAGVPLALGSAVYTAFLFGQAEGRDLWQSSLLPVQMILQAAGMGAAALLILAPLVGAPPQLIDFARSGLGASLTAGLLALLLGEVAMPHATDAAAQAASALLRGRWARHFWLGGILGGHALPLALLMIDGTVPQVTSASAAIAGLASLEYAFVMAPQSIPNS